MMRYLQRFLGQLKNELLEEQVPDSSRAAPNPYLARVLVLQDIEYHESAPWQSQIYIFNRGYEIGENQVKSAIDYLLNRKFIEHADRPPLECYKTTELGSRLANSAESPEEISRVWSAIEPITGNEQNI